jgi:hypothetical protein
MRKFGFIIGLLTITIIAIIWSIISVGYLSTEDSQIYYGIQSSNRHPQYWSYNGEEILLLGGSVEDNLFQIPDLKEHLDLLVEVGGNYVRNTMSSRDEGNVWPFRLGSDSLYDLNEWNDEYWQRFEIFLKETHRRKIIVQLEVWATFDFYRENWLVNPFNPKNNKNYDARRTKLDLEVDSHPIYTENNFFRSVPSQMSIMKLLEYQQKYVDKILSYTLSYDHVLYCMDNETSVTSDWGKFWAHYIRKVGLEMAMFLQTTEMWDPWDLNHIVHRETTDNPDTFSFVDISQNNHNSGETHWLNGIKRIEHLKQINAVRPCNNVKVYGNDGGRHQTTQNGIESFVRNVMFGSAGTRFHRPTSGQGLNPVARKVIQGLRTITDEMDFFNGMPLDHVIINKSPNEAYCRGVEGKEYLFYFTNGGDINVSISLPGGNGIVKWLSLDTRDGWKESAIQDGDSVTLSPPGKGNWLALIQ